METISYGGLFCDGCDPADPLSANCALVSVYWMKILRFCCLYCEIYDAL